MVGVYKADPEWHRCLLYAVTTDARREEKNTDSIAFIARPPPLTFFISFLPHLLLPLLLSAALQPACSLLASNLAAWRCAPLCYGLL